MKKRRQLYNPIEGDLLKTVKRANDSSEFGWAAVGGGRFRVLFHLPTGFANASKLISMYAKNTGKRAKQYSDFRRLGMVKDAVDNLCAEFDCEADKLCIKTWSKQNKYTFQGTYVHPDLIYYVMFWVDSTYLLEVVRLQQEMDTYRLLSRVKRNFARAAQSMDVVSAEMRNAMNQILGMGKELEDIGADLRDFTKQTNNLIRSNQQMNQKMYDACKEITTLLL